jgi:hypothetical protein
MNLCGNKLEGTIPSNILASMTKLTNLVLANNNFKGTIPSSLGSLTELNALFLSNSNLEGTIPSSLGSLTKLTNLWLDGNYLTGLVPPLPFKQYSGNGSCRLDFPLSEARGGCYEPKCNHFKCPLPAGSDQCKWIDDYSADPGPQPGVHCK